MNAGGDKLYMGLAATNSTDGKESIGYLDPRLEEQLEYDVAKLIYKLSSAKKPVVGWLSSIPMGGDFDMQTGRPKPPSAVYQQIEQLYTVRASNPRSPPSMATSTCWCSSTRRACHRRRCTPSTSSRCAVDTCWCSSIRAPRPILPRPATRTIRWPQMQADRSSDLQPLFTSWGVDFKPDQVVVDLEHGLEVSMRRGRAALATHRHPRASTTKAWARTSSPASSTPSTSRRRVA